MQRKNIMLALLVASTLLLGAACGSSQTNSNINATVETYDVSYAGQDGKTALDLLDQTHEIKASNEGFVSSIDGQEAGDRQYWAFYVNDVLADTGAKDYVTKNGEQIGWRLEAY